MKSGYRRHSFLDATGYSFLPVSGTMFVVVRFQDSSSDFQIRCQIFICGQIFRFGQIFGRCASFDWLFFCFRIVGFSLSIDDGDDDDYDDVLR